MSTLDPAYGLVVLIGISLSVVLVESEMRKRADWPRGSTVVLLCIATPAGIVGAKLAGSLDAREELGEQPWRLAASAGDCASWGGIAAGGLVIGWLLHKRKLPVLAFFDAAVPGLLLAYAVGRLACHATADGCHGVATSLPWAIDVPSAGGVTSESVHPTAIYEAVFALLLLPIALVGVDRLRAGRPGPILGLYLVLHWSFRFGVEFIRVNPKHAGLSGAQWASIALVLCGIGVIVFTRRHLAAKAPADQRDREAALEELNLTPRR